MVSITTSPRIACRPSLVSHDHALDRAVLDDRRREPAVQPELDAGLGDELIGGALEGVGVEGGGEARSDAASDGVWKSNRPQRAHFRHAARSRGAGSRSASGGETHSPQARMRSIISMQMPRTVISVPLCMSSSTSTMPPEARPPR